MANIHNGINEILRNVVLHAFYILNIIITNIKRLNHISITDDQFKLSISRMAPSIYTQVISLIESSRCAIKVPF